MDPNGKSIPSGAPSPASNPLPGEYDPIKYRVPRQPMLILFVQGAPRAQSYQAEMEQKEGWFADEGWSIDELADQDQKWFPDSPTPVVVGGGGRRWSQEEWGKAATMWQVHGDRYGLIVEPARMKSYEDVAGEMRGRSEPTEKELGDPAFRIKLLMSDAPRQYEMNRQLTNFPFFLVSSQAERQPETVDARRTLWRAEQARKFGKKALAMDLYKKGLLDWREVLRRNADYHRNPRSDKAEEETYAFELAYLRLIVQDDQSVRDKATALVAQGKTVISVMPFPLAKASPLGLSVAQDEAKWVIAENDPTYSPFVGSMDTTDARRGGPWIRPDIKNSVRQQQGVQRASDVPVLDPGPEGPPGTRPGAPPDPRGIPGGPPPPP
jgi:hypothetical protein